MDKHAYENDFHAWTVEQSAALRRAAELGSNLGLDFENLAEEIESMGRSHKREIGNRLKQILIHLLKLEWSPDAPPRAGWIETVNEQRSQIAALVEESPSLSPVPAMVLDKEWGTIRRQGVPGAGLRSTDLPIRCPYTAEQALDDTWWPVNRHGVGASDQAV